PRSSRQVTVLRALVTLVALLLALGHLIWPMLAIDTVTLVLLVIAIIPWVAPLFKSLEFPGGWKVEFQELQKAAQRAEQAGLLSPAPFIGPKDALAFQRVAEPDLNLALAGLDVVIEMRLVVLAEKLGVEGRGRRLGQLLRFLSERDSLGREERSVL